MTCQGISRVTTDADISPVSSRLGYQGPFSHIISLLEIDKAVLLLSYTLCRS
jgi:hypothetical protein